MQSRDDEHAGPDAELLALAARIELVVFDVDGVLTDGRLIGALNMHTLLDAGVI